MRKYGGFVAEAATAKHLSKRHASLECPFGTRFVAPSARKQGSVLCSAVFLKAVFAGRGATALVLTACRCHVLGTACPGLCPAAGNVFRVSAQQEALSILTVLLNAALRIFNIIARTGALCELGCGPNRTLCPALGVCHRGGIAGTHCTVAYFLEWSAVNIAWNHAR